MTLKRGPLLAASITLVAAGWCVWSIHALETRLGQIASHSAPALSLAPSPSNVEQRLKKLETASPRVGDTMCGIQLHFAKLYYASQARNWDLARFERGEIEEALDTVAALRPEENGVNLAGIIGAFKQSPLTALTDAVDMKDSGLFRAAYQDSVVMCNACHQATGRSFINITIPTNPPVSNQRWEPLAYSQ